MRFVLFLVLVVNLIPALPLLPVITLVDNFNKLENAVTETVAVIPIKYHFRVKNLLFKWRKTLKKQGKFDSSRLLNMCSLIDSYA